MKFTANRRRVLGMAAIGMLFGFWQPVEAAPVLPDLIAWADQSKNYIYGGAVNASLVPGETVYRFTGALPNIGPGRLEVREVTHPDATQDVYQRIYDENGTLDHERLIGSFPDADSIAPRQLIDISPGLNRPSANNLAAASLDERAPCVTIRNIIRRNRRRRRPATRTLHPGIDWHGSARKTGLESSRKRGHACALEAPHRDGRRSANRAC